MRCMDWNMSDMNPAALEKVLTFRMPYGKHQGRILAELPGNYLAWFARQGFPKGELGQLLELMYTLDHNNLRNLLRPLKKGNGNLAEF